MRWLRDLLFVTWVGCSGLGERTPSFPEGEPLNCDVHSPEFQLALQLTRAVFWLITAGTALVGKRVATVALCMTGSAMLMSGLIDLTKRLTILAVPDQAQTVVLAIEPVRVFVGYGLAAVGVLVQSQIMKPSTHTEEGGGGGGGKGKGEGEEACGADLLKAPSEVALRPLRCLVSPLVITCLLRPVLAFNAFLRRMMEDTKEAKPEEKEGAGSRDADAAVPLVGPTPASFSSPTAGLQEQLGGRVAGRPQQAADGAVA